MLRRIQPKRVSGLLRVGYALLSDREPHPLGGVDQDRGRDAETSVFPTMPHIDARNNGSGDHLVRDSGVFGAEKPARKRSSATSNASGVTSAVGRVVATSGIRTASVRLWLLLPRDDAGYRPIGRCRARCRIGSEAACCPTVHLLHAERLAVAAIRAAAFLPVVHILGQLMVMYRVRMATVRRSTS